MMRTSILMTLLPPSGSTSFSCTRRSLIAGRAACRRFHQNRVPPLVRFDFSDAWFLSAPVRRRVAPKHSGFEQRFRMAAGIETDKGAVGPSRTRMDGMRQEFFCRCRFHRAAGRWHRVVQLAVPVA